MKKITTILISIAAFLLIWFYIQPFAEDVDTIVDDLIYTEEEKIWDNYKENIRKREQREIDSLQVELDKFNKIADSIFNLPR